MNLNLHRDRIAGAAGLVLLTSAIMLALGIGMMAFPFIYPEKGGTGGGIIGTLFTLGSGFNMALSWDTIKHTYGKK